MKDLVTLSSTRTGIGVAGLVLALMACLWTQHLCAATNSPASVYLLPTNAPNFFASDHLTGAGFFKFSPNGTYEHIAREHMGVIPLDSGHWTQASNGVVLLSATNTRWAGKTDKTLPMQYKGKAFLLWPERSYMSKAGPVCAKLESGTNGAHVYNEIQISEDEYLKGTSRPYPFKYHKELNKVTGAEP